MSLMNWLFPKSRRAKSAPASSSAASSGSSGKGTSKDAAAQSSRRKGERTARRELLYTVVRETMVRAGVLSASYKFKVLSLDPNGRQYLIMIDLARESGRNADQKEIEALIAQSAKSRHDILVTAVYWRINDHVGAGTSARGPKTSNSQPMPLESQPAPFDSAPTPLAPTGRPAYDPIQADEVEAFKKALVEGSTGPVPLAATATAKPRPDGKQGPRNYTLLTGYEDTEMPDADHKAPLLSGTQYGDLR
jgi:hypothetical protein